MIDTARKLNEMIDRRSRWQFALLMLPMICVALLEMLSLGMVIPVIQVMLFGGDGGQYTEIVDRLVPFETVGEDERIIISAAFCVVFAIKSFLLIAMIYVINRTVYLKVSRFSVDLYSLYLHRPLPFHLERNNAELLRNLTSGASLTFESVRHVLMIVFEALLMIAAIALLFLIEPTVTLVMAVTLGVLALLFYRVAAPIFRHWGACQQALEGSMIKWIVQSLSSIRDIKLFNSYAYLDRGLRDIVSQRARYQTLSVSSLHVPRLFLETVVIVGFMLLIGVMAASNTPREQIVATLGVFGMAAIRILPSLNRILSSGAELRQRSAYIDTLHADWTAGHADAESEAAETDSPAVPFTRTLEVRGVSFTYPGAGAPALNDIDLTIGKGESIGFVGPSGGGKSTLVDILLGLLEPARGSVRADGVDIATDRSGWRSRIGFVPQHIYLLDDTVRRNIAFGKRDDEIDEGRVAEAIRLAHLNDVVDRLPHGLDTVIGEQGTRLSGGQRQRVAIARAIYPDPDILVFDEATSALDTISEAEITKAIESLGRTRTVLIIAHRLSTIRNCDRVIYLCDGRIVDQGKYAELCTRNAEFAVLAASGRAEPEEITV